MASKMGYPTRSGREARTRGKLLHDFHKSYVSLDIETTGMGNQKVIEIGAVKVEGGEIVEEQEIFVKGWSLEEISYGHPTPLEYLAHSWAYSRSRGQLIDEALRSFRDFSGSSVLLGQNLAGFDLNVLNQWAVQTREKPILNDYVDTLPLSRKVHPKLPNHKLSTLTRYYNLGTVEHTALSDARQTHFVYQNLWKDALDANSFTRALPSSYPHRESASIALAKQNIVEQDGLPLEGLNICVTGDFSLSRQEVWNLIAANGGTPLTGVTKKTTHLLLGSLATVSSKQRKAREFNIPIISWHDLQTMLKSKESKTSSIQPIDEA